MKLLATAAFLVVVGLGLFVGAKQQKWTLEALRGTRGNGLLFLASILSLLLSFTAFAVLTRQVPYYLILLLVAASLLGLMINLMIGAIAGFGLKEKRLKIGALSVIWSAQSPAPSCAFVIVALLYFVFAWAASLWVFWTRPIGDPTVTGWVAFYQFFLPQFIFVPFAVAMSWPVVTSEFIDDDFRNSHLTGFFTRTMHSTVSLVFPVWLFHEQFGSVLGRWLPPFWLLLSFPALVLILGGVFPFFVGMYRFRSQARALLEWRRHWAQVALQLVKLPVGEQRSTGLTQHLADLEDEIRRRLEENKLLQFYQQLLLNESGSASLPLLPAAQEVTDSQSTELTESNPKEAGSSAELLIKQHIKSAKSYLRTSYSSSPKDDADISELVRTIIKENRNKLVVWDVRFAHLEELLDLYQVTLDGKSLDISGFLEAHIKALDGELTTQTTPRNFIAASLLSAISAGAIYVLKEYQTEFIGLISQLVAAPPSS